MLLLFGISVVFMAISFLARRPWTIAVPFVVWLGLWALGSAGVLSDGTSLDAALLAGVVGAFFSIAGLLFGGAASRRQPRT